jgi:hypothetical protein
VFGSSVVIFAGSGVGLILLAIGQTMVAVCACSDMVRALSVPRSHRRYVASTVFRTLAIPSIIATGMSVLIDALSLIEPDFPGGAA